MRNVAWIVTLAAAPAALSTLVAADNQMPEMRGTRKGDSHSIVLGGRLHHPDTRSDEPRFIHAGGRQAGWPPVLPNISVDAAQRDVVAVASRAGSIFMADDDG